MGQALIAQWAKTRLDHWLTSSWASSLSDAVSEKPPDLAPSVVPHDPSPVAWAKWADPLWVEVPCGVAEGAVMRAGCARATAAALGALFRGGNEIDEELVDETFRELVSRIVEGVASAVLTHSGKNLESGPAVAAQAPMLTDLGLEFRVELDGATHLLAVVPNAEMLGEVLALRGAQHAASVASEQSPDDHFGDAREVAQAAGDDGAVRLSNSAQKNLRMLLDVELDLAISFGSTDLPLQDVLKLASGSIVELNRNAADPVDVLVNGRVIARGEVVVVDGNYGIRITEIVSRQERIRSVF